MRKILHRGVEALFDDRAQPVDLVDEEDVARVELGEEAGERAFVLDDRAVRHVERDAHLVREDLREGRLAQTGRAAKEEVIERLAPLLRGGDEHAEVLLVLLLADVIVERARTQRAVETRVLGLLDGVDVASVSRLVRLRALAHRRHSTIAATAMGASA